MQLAYQPAPPDEMVRYLAVLRRALKSIARRGSQDSVSGLLFTGWLADALHNVPGILWHWDEESWWKPSEIETWITTGFPANMKRFGGTPAIVEEARTITAVSGGDAALLGLAGDLSDLSLAPQAAQERYLDLLYNYLLRARVIRNYERTRANPFRALLGTSVWNRQKLFEAGNENAVVASVLQEIPAALVAWDRFDEKAFAERGLARFAAISTDHSAYYQRALEALKTA